MTAMVRATLLAVLPLIALSAQAKSPSEVFDIASRSTVVVLAYDSQGKVAGLGSGVVLPDGAVATNCHVIKAATRLAVRHRKQEYAATARHTDWARDTCSLTAAGLDAPPVGLGSTRGLKVGARVYAVGAPRGLELTLSEGLVSSLREIEGGRYIQTTAPISPGSSGGGLFDDEGRLLGLTTFYLAEGQNLNFALPVEWIGELPGRHAARTSQRAATVDWLNSAIALEQQENWQGLIRHSLRWTDAIPDSDVAWSLLGTAYGNSGQLAKAIEALQRALAIAPDNAVTRYNLGLAYLKSGQTAEAIKAYQRAVAIHPRDATAWHGLGNAYSTLADPAYATKAKEAFQRALAIDPGDAAAWSGLGGVYGHSGQSAKAIEAHKRALAIDPGFSAAWSGLGSAYEKSGQTAEAIEAYQRVLGISPRNVFAWTTLAKAYGRSGQTAKAIEAYQRALKIDPGLDFAWQELGVTYRLSGQTGKAFEAYPGRTHSPIIAAPTPAAACVHHHPSRCPCGAGADSSSWLGRVLDAADSRPSW